MGMNGGGGGGMGNACYVYPGAPATPGFVTPDVLFQRGIYMNGSMRFDDGNSVTIWGFTDLAAGGAGAPAAIRWGRFLSFAGHTRHRRADRAYGVVRKHDVDAHHPSSRHRTQHRERRRRPSVLGRDGRHLYLSMAAAACRHLLLSLPREYTPACGDGHVWRADRRPQTDARRPRGHQTGFYNGPKYDVEAIWACDEIDPNWHTLPWYAGTCGGDVGLNNLNPRYFIITGVDGASSALTNPAVAVNMTLGQTLLVRYICAGFYPQKISFGGLTASVVASDGRPLPAAWNTGAIEAHSAERYDCIIKPTSRGTWTVTVQFFHWRTGAVLGTAKTRITVA